MPAGEAAAGFSASMATAPSLSFSSTTMRSAVFLPTPGIFVSRTRSPPRIAGTSSSTLIPERILSARSEEHTSELQSQSNLVCRLLLEKKKNNRNYDVPHAPIPRPLSLLGLPQPPLTQPEYSYEQEPYQLHVERDHASRKSASVGTDPT